MPRCPRPITLVALLALALAGTAACGSDGVTSPSADAQGLAQTGLLQSYSATYALTGAKGSPDGRLSVWRTPSGLRLDVSTPTGVATSITTPAGTVACQKKSTGGTPTCLTVAGPAKTPPGIFDPVLRKVFGDVLRVLAADDNGLTISGVDPTAIPASTPTSTPSGVGEVRCFAVSGPTGSVVATGTYCLDANGVPVRLVFASGSATLTGYTPGAPAASSFTPPVAPTPLPTAAG